eukprot:jgi/Ulvmu1/11271/UM073_0043.1
MKGLPPELQLRSLAAPRPPSSNCEYQQSGRFLIHALKLRFICTEAARKRPVWQDGAAELEVTHKLGGSARCVCRGDDPGGGYRTGHAHIGHDGTAGQHHKQIALFWVALRAVSGWAVQNLHVRAP